LLELISLTVGFWVKLDTNRLARLERFADHSEIVRYVSLRELVLDGLWEDMTEAQSPRGWIVNVDRPARGADRVDADRQDVLEQRIELATAGEFSGSNLDRSDKLVVGLHPLKIVLKC
jgi:hypothetical protein